MSEASQVLRTGDQGESESSIQALSVAINVSAFTGSPGPRSPNSCWIGSAPRGLQLGASWLINPPPFSMSVAFLFKTNPPKASTY